MDRFFSNLGGGGGDKKGNNNSKKKDSSWGGGAGGMDTIKKKNSIGSKDKSTLGGNSGRIGGGVGGSAKSGGNNPFANAGAGINDVLGKMMQNKNTGSKRGGGQSLGGSKPGRVFSVSLDKPGPLGLEVERRRDAQSSAIIASVIPGSQADKAGLQRGDIVCRARSNGNEELSYDAFIKTAKSGQRPLEFDVRRIESSIDTSGGGKVSADALHRKQAMIAAAEAREAKHKAKTKPVPKATTNDRLLLSKDRRLENTQQRHYETNDCDETRRAVDAIKQAEKEDALNLGYNPYEAKAMTSGQARTATVVMTKGEIDASKAPSKITGEGETSAPGRVNAPRDPTTQSTPLSPEFEQAFSIHVTSNSDHTAVLNSLGIMRKLIVNATTKGQQGDNETSSKFRRVRLSNPKIKAAITDMQGALDLMMSVGFVLSENDEDGETYLVFSPGEKGAEWLGSALERMEAYERGG